MDEVLRPRDQGKSFRDFLVDADKHSERVHVKPTLAAHLSKGLSLEHSGELQCAREVYADAYSFSVNTYGSTSKQSASVLLDRFRVEIAAGQFDQAFIFLSQAFSSISTKRNSHETEQIQVELALRAAKACLKYEYVDHGVMDLLRASEVAATTSCGALSRERLEVLTTLGSIYLLAGKGESAYKVAREGMRIIRDGKLGRSLSVFENEILLAKTSLRLTLHGERIEGILLRTLSAIGEFYLKAAADSTRFELNSLRLKATLALSETYLTEGRVDQAGECIHKLLSVWESEQICSELHAEALIELARIAGLQRDLCLAWHHLKQAKDKLLPHAGHLPLYARMLGERSKILGDIATRLDAIPAHKLEILRHGNWSSLLLPSLRSLPPGVEKRFADFEGECLSDYVEELVGELKLEAEKDFVRAENLLLALNGQQGATALASVVSLHFELLVAFGESDRANALVLDTRSRKHLHSFLMDSSFVHIEAA